MLREERFQLILDILKRTGKADYDLLAGELQVSPDTIRRDIEMLNKNGLLSKVRGGAIARSKNPLSFNQRQGYLSKGKNIIALKAQQFIKEGQTIFIDGGTTNCAIVSQLPVNLKCRVVTNNLALVSVISKNTNLEVIVLGGKYDAISQTTYGNIANREIDNYVADIFFMGTCAIDSGFGVTAAIQEEAGLKKAMQSASHKTIALSNREKLGTTDHFKVCDFNTLDALITDLPSDHKSLDVYRGMNVELI